MPDLAQDTLISKTDNDDDSKVCSSSSSASSSSSTLSSSNEKDDLCNKLKENYDKVLDKLNQAFDSLRLSIDTRQENLITELNKIYQEKKDLIEFDAVEEPIELLDFTVNTDQKNSDLVQIINNYGKIFSTSSSLLNMECSISGRGLKQCYVNEESIFVLSFKNRDGSFANKANVSFLDIFIITTDVEQAKPKSTLTNSARSRSRPSTPTSRSPRCNCECKLECVADGVYEVKYKLDKKGTYTLNILVNKIHIGDSPYKLTCLEKPVTSTGRVPVKSQSAFNVQAINKTSSAQNNNNNNSNKENKLINNSKFTKNSFINNLNTKSSSSNSLILPNNYKNIRLSTPTPTSSSSIAKSKRYSSTSFSRKSDSKTNLVSQDDSIISSAPSVLSDSPTSPMSPAISRANISSANEFPSGEDDFLFQIGRRGRNSSEFMNPQAVCATNDLIYITDSNNQKIDAFTHSGEFKFSLGSTTSSFNSKIIRRPCGIDATTDGKILVVDYEYKWVNVFEVSGKFLSKICQNKLLGPKGICINKACNNQIIIADSKANSVCIFDSEGKFLQRFGNLGSKNENFSGPQYVSCMSNGDIVVTDFYNHCIKVFDFNGKFRFSFGSNGSNQGQFNGPTGVAVDLKDNIIVVDWGNSRVQVFNKHGEFIRYINCEINHLYGPQDLAVINNTVAVADSGNHCVKLFEYS